MTASLPMYWRAETAPAWQRLWEHVHRETGLGPEHLATPQDLWAHWRHPDMVLSQTCGLPFRLGLHETTTLVGTFDFDLPQTPAGYYYSVIIKGPADGPIAINSADSQSGWAALWEWSGGDLPESTILTGAHAASVAEVAESRASLAAIDAVTWALLQDHAPDAVTGVNVIARTKPTPGLPLITNQPDAAGPLLDALKAGIAALSDGDRAILHLRGIVNIPKTDYLAQPIPPGPSLDPAPTRC